MVFETILFETLVDLWCKIVKTRNMSKELIIDFKYKWSENKIKHNFLLVLSIKSINKWISPKTTRPVTIWLLHFFISPSRKVRINISANFLPFLIILHTILPPILFLFYHTPNKCSQKLIATQTHRKLTITQIHQKPTTNQCHWKPKINQCHQDNPRKGQNTKIFKNI